MGGKKEKGRKVGDGKRGTGGNGKITEMKGVKKGPL